MRVVTYSATAARNRSMNKICCELSNLVLMAPVTGIGIRLLSHGNCCQVFVKAMTTDANLVVYLGMALKPLFEIDMATETGDRITGTALSFSDRTVTVDAALFGFIVMKCVRIVKTLVLTFNLRTVKYFQFRTGSDGVSRSGGNRLDLDRVQAISEADHGMED